MLLLNGEQFIPSAENPKHALQTAHYTEAIADIREQYSKGGRNRTIVLTRRKEQKRNEAGMLEETPPMIFPAQATPTIQLAEKHKRQAAQIGGMETWAYSNQQPRRKAHGEPFEPVPKSIQFMYQFESFDIIDDIELIYFLLYKSPRVYYPPAIAQGKVKRGDLMVEDKALKAKERVEKQREELKLKNAILAPDIQYPLHNDDNLRKVAAAWGIDGAMDEYTTADALRIQLEHAVEQGEKDKISMGEGKGYAEFFELINFDDSVRQRALVMYALDSGTLRFDQDKGRYSYATGDVLLEVPSQKRNKAFDYIASYFSNELNETAWKNFAKEVIDEAYIKQLNFGDLKWLAKMNGLPVSQKSTEALVESLCKVYCG